MRRGELQGVLLRLAVLVGAPLLVSGCGEGSSVAGPSDVPLPAGHRVVDVQPGVCIEEPDRVCIVSDPSYDAVLTVESGQESADPELAQAVEISLASGGWAPRRTGCSYDGQAADDQAFDFCRPAGGGQECLLLLPIGMGEYGLAWTTPDE